MDVAIGLPNAVAGTEGDQLIDWARRADSAGFSSLGTLDRLVYPSYEPLVSLAAAAAVTERIGLATTILLAPLRVNAALLAKQAASLHRLSGGRLLLGMAPGMREDDFQVSHVSYGDRSASFDAMLDEMQAVWSGDDIGPYATPDVIIGGQVDAAFRRAAKHGIGWIMGGGTPDQFRKGRAKIEAAWRGAGREGEPRKMGLAYYSLGPDADQNAEKDLKHYYAYLGEYAEQVVASAATDEQTVMGYIAAFEDVGCDELFLFPCSSDPDQVDRLAEAAL
jgi:alkanesulfonate monooxygenase SsuD/methylene tetrahydromethanopterin reductase-like flavin-dependent oxidoreductase (luciferase family)